MIQQPNLRIIIIDDNPTIHQDFIKILTFSQNKKEIALNALDKQIFGDNNDRMDKVFSLPQFQIDTASQGKEGFHRIAEELKKGNPYALAFVDIRMPPGWDGIETIKNIWKLDKNIQIVICTAYSDYSWEDTVEQLGQTDNLLILKKPFDNVAVRQLACALTKKWQLMQQTREYSASLEEKIQERTLSLQKSLSLSVSLEKKLKYQASHDDLSGLPNRISMFEKINQAILNAKSQNSMALLFLDLDRFKLINDSLGHAAGDDVIKAFAERLKNFIPNDYIVARMGGDEFVIFVPHVENKNKLFDYAFQLLSIGHEPFKIAAREITINSSIGISLFPQDGTTPYELLKHADVAMYSAKDLGANQIQFYSDDLNQQTLERLEKENDLRKALIQNEFFLCYQPQFDIVSGKLVAVETLARWRHPTKGIILPMDFIPIAEETGLIIQLGQWILKHACKQNKIWQDAGLPPIRIAVNITSQQFKQPNFVALIDSFLKETGLDPKYLELEVTENTIISNPIVIRTITDLKALGIAIVLDDFGTGYSCLSYLKRIPLDGLKIDRSFIRNIAVDRGDEVIIQAIIAMAHSLNLNVMAEGVESQEQLSFLKSKKCEGVQGFYFSEPLSSEELIKILNVNLKK